MALPAQPLCLLCHIYQCEVRRQIVFRPETEGSWLFTIYQDSFHGWFREAAIFPVVLGSVEHEALAASLRSSDASKCLTCACGLGKAAMGICCGKTGVSSCEVNHITIHSVSLGICLQLRKGRDSLTEGTTATNWWWFKCFLESPVVLKRKLRHTN
ncbi:hypothetical protein BDP67DRAFT_492005 [Colletotrichum lupini]|nr:hypothetical protein BDP67DRAFT_492005 [Colletotrichum lupini]